MDSTLTSFFHPKGVVLIGASTDPRKLGYGAARNLIESGYTGAVHLVNPKGGTLLGHPLYPSLDEVPDPVDLAVVLIAAPLVPPTLEAIGRRGIRAAIVASGGFRETGEEGAALEAEIARIGREYGIRLIGPNCIGLLDTHLPLDTTFLPPPGPTPGNIAFISHSGAICEVVIDWARGQGFGLSRLVSLGNQVDVCETDALEAVADDPHTRVITMYLEGVRDGRRFVEAARRVTREKPVIALKVGRYASGRRAAASHTGALAGQESAFNAAFRASGVLRADTSEQTFDWARALAWCPLPRGRRVAVLTNAGGPGVTAADALEAQGLQLADLDEATCTALRDLLPPAASVHNPVDMLASASPEQYAESLRLLLEDDGVDMVMVILPPPPMFTAGAMARVLTPVIQTTDKPVVIALMGERMIQEAVEIFRAAHVPEYRFPERAAEALGVLARRAEALVHTADEPVRFPDVRPEIVRNALRSPAVRAGEWLPSEVVQRILAAYGVRMPRVALARDARQAADLAREMGFPVALKVASPDIPHKSDVGGVLLNLDSFEAVSRGFITVTQNARRAVPGAEILGVHVQRMIPQGQEVIVGSVQDPQFGPLVMFGSGGVEVEGLGDVAFALAPLSANEVDYLLENTWAGRRLRGFRHLPPADREAVREVILRLAQLASDFPQLSEIEINPLRVLADGQGAFAVDARAKLC